VNLVWFVDPETRTVRVFTSPDDVTTLTAKVTLTGGEVLPGFAVPVADLFASLPPVKKPAPKPKKKKK
jgi:Uma2 family endonuclease